MVTKTKKYLLTNGNIFIGEKTTTKNKTRKLCLNRSHKGPHQPNKFFSSFDQPFKTRVIRSVPWNFRADPVRVLLTRKFPFGPPNVTSYNHPFNRYQLGQTLRVGLSQKAPYSGEGTHQPTKFHIYKGQLFESRWFDWIPRYFWANPLGVWVPYQPTKYPLHRWLDSEAMKKKIAFQ